MTAEGKVDKNGFYAFFETSAIMTVTHNRNRNNNCFLLSQNPFFGELVKLVF